MELDLERIKQSRKQTTVSGEHLLVWERIREYMREKGFRVDLEDYLVTFDEDDISYSVTFIKPVKEPLPGGGGARVEVRKKDLHVSDFRFSR